MKNLLQVESLHSLILISIIFLSSCIPSKQAEYFSFCRWNHSTSKERRPLYIEMPENKIVFENLSPMVYDVLWRHFSRVGFRLCDKKDAWYYLKITIKNVETDYRFLSPDLLTYAIKMKIDLLCELRDREKNIAKKMFSFRTLIPKAKDYVANSLFTHVEYRRLFEREAYKIDHYFREKMK